MKRRRAPADRRLWFLRDSTRLARWQDHRGRVSVPGLHWFQYALDEYQKSMLRALEKHTDDKADSEALGPVSLAFRYWSMGCIVPSPLWEGMNATDAILELFDGLLFHSTLPP